MRPVKLGVTDGDRVEVLSGLQPGDRVVIDGADQLRDGAKIIVRIGGRREPGGFGRFQDRVLEQRGSLVGHAFGSAGAGRAITGACFSGFL